MDVQSKAIHIAHKAGEKFVEVKISGTLTVEDYEHFVPEMDQRIKDLGKIRLMVLFENFHGWTAGAMWEDTKFGLKHYSDIERLAIVGDKKWEKGMAYFCKPFTKAEVQYFDVSKIEEAKKWLSL
jgi:hypothetical protein